MNTTIKMTLAAALAAAALAPVAHAAGTEGVSIIYTTALDSGSNRAQMDELDAKAMTPGATQAAQAEAAADPAISHELATSNVALHNVLEIDTAANGGKIVYVR